MRKAQRNPYVNDLPLPKFMPEGVYIPLLGSHKNKSALVDFEDAPLVVEHRWYYSRGYATSAHHRIGTSRNGTRRTVNLALHRLVMGTPAKPDLVVDHINGNRLDNRRANLRWVAVRENNHNLSYHRDGYVKASNPEGYMGVAPGKGCSSWQVRVGTKHYGHWTDLKLAARVYDLVVRTLRPNQRALNFPDEPLPSDFSIPGLNAPVRRAKYRSTVSGVSWFSPKAKWRVIVARKTLGYFDTQRAAEEFRAKLRGNSEDKVRKKNKTA